MSDSRSWFYLTLWRGTPPEFTENLTATIQDSESANALIHTLDEVGSKISTVASFSSRILKSEAFTAGITKETEIIWYVG